MASKVMKKNSFGKDQRYPYGKCGEFQKKCKSRDAARSRRGQQNDEFAELSHQLPLPRSISTQLDRLCIMRLTNSYIKIKRLLNSLMTREFKEVIAYNFNGSSFYDKDALEAMDGFVYVAAQDGQCLYVSDNITHYLGLSQIEVTGNSLYKYVHPCDHEELANQLGGRIPLEDMEIFDGLFCSDSVFMMSNNLKAGSKRDQNESHYKSFFLRMKSTLTSRGKSVNLRASTYRVAHCTGSMKYKTVVNENGEEEKVPLFLVAIAVPLMFATTFEVPLDRGTFTSRHMLDMKFLQCDDRVTSLLGYSREELIGKSWYNFHHAADLENVLTTHKMLLTKGQSVSKYYRFMVRDGGWVWLQTKAHVVYDSKTCQPQFVFCINFVLGGKENRAAVLTSEQINPMPSAMALEGIIKQEEGTVPVARLAKESIVLEEQAKARKSMAKEAKNHVIKTEPTYATCKIKKEVTAKDCSCVDVDCEHMNFQECTPVDWEDVIRRQQEYERCTWDHYLQPKDMETPPMSPKSATPMDESPTTDCTSEERESTEKVAIDDDEDLQNRAPFIPPPFVDAGLMCNDELLADIQLADSPITVPAWLDGDELLQERKLMIPPTSYKSFSTETSPLLSRKHAIPLSMRRNGYITNELLTGDKVLFPYVTPSDAEVNAPVQNAGALLQGQDLLNALDTCELTQSFV